MSPACYKYDSVFAGNLLILLFRHAISAISHHTLSCLLNRLLIAACLLGWMLPVTAADTPDIEVRFEGVTGRLQENIAASVTLNRQRKQALNDSRIRFLYRRAPDEIRKAMKVFGYYDPDIKTELKKTDDHWLALFRIDPGKPVTIQEIDISLTGAGADSEEFRQLREDHPFKPGERLEHETYSDYKNRLSRRARELGYFDAHFDTHQLRVNTQTREAGIVLKFDTGYRYHYGPVDFSATTPFSEEFLRNYIPFREGQPYTSAGPQKLRQNLINSDFFSSIEVTPEDSSGEEKTVPVKVTLEPRKPNRYTAGVGFATDTGPRLSLGWDARYLNERGHKFSSKLQLSPVLSNLTSTYLMPYFRNREADIGVSGSLKNEDTESVESRSGQATLFQNTERWGWNETLSATYLVEDYDVADDSNVSNLLIPGINWRRSWSDDPIYATHGGRLSLDLKGAAEPLLSSTSFIQARIAGKYVKALGFRNRLLTRLELGATEVSDFEKLPASLRFFAGGDNSIRGYDYQSLGPTNAAGEVTGGRYLIVGSIEYEQFVYKDWGVATFVDFGNAVNDFSDPLEVGTGVGLRWLSPVGLVKVDVAAGVTEDDMPIRLHISIGSDL